jgi:hypothetical protein
VGQEVREGGRKLDGEAGSWREKQEVSERSKKLDREAGS